jgi:hypothetical protein
VSEERNDGGAVAGDVDVRRLEPKAPEKADRGPDMTDEERQQFEREELHHDREVVTDGGPASEPDVVPREQPGLPGAFPNPD